MFWVFPIFIIIEIVGGIRPSGFAEDFRSVALRLHNEYRRLAGVSDRPLRLDTELNTIALDHAEKLANSGGFEFSGKGFEENLWSYEGVFRSLNVDTRDAVNSWYMGTKVPGEIQCNTSSMEYLTGKIEYLGIGVGTGSENYTVVVAEYY